MTVKTFVPSNPSLLESTNFKFSVDRLPAVSYFCQAVTIPAITLGTADVQTPFSKIPFPGDKPQFGELLITFKVDEDFVNYKEMYDWLISLSFPDGFTQYTYTTTSPTSDASLTVLSNLKNPNYEFKFFDLFPTTLGNIELNTTLTDAQFVTCTAVFAYRKFSIVNR